MAKKLPKELSPLANWILAVVDERDITIADLAREARLSHATLRGLITYPERTPTLETCLRLSDATEKPVEEIFTLAGITTTINPMEVHPDRSELVHLYDSLPNGKARQALLDVARVFSETLEGV